MALGELPSVNSPVASAFFQPDGDDVAVFGAAALEFAVQGR